MNTKTATITIEMEGGFEIDFSKNHYEIEKFIIDNLIKELNFRKESIKMASLNEKENDIPAFISVSNPKDTIKFKKITQKIDLLF